MIRRITTDALTMGRRARGIEDSSGWKGLKPYASVSFGAAVNRLRRTVANTASSTDEFAPKLGVGGSTLRMIEAGALVPPVTMALGMVKEFDLSMASTITMLGFVITIDRHESVEGRITAAKAMANYEPRLQFFAEVVIAATRKFSGGESLNEVKRIAANPELVSKIIDYMKRPFGGVMINREQDVLSQIASTISPIYVDALAQLSASLRAFQPNLTLDGLNGWERSVNNRIGRFCGYHEDPQVLVDTFEDSNWEFLWNNVPRTPKYVLITPGPRRVVNAFIKLLTEKFGKTKEDVYKSILVVNELPGSLRKGFDLSLWFDVEEKFLGLTHDSVSVDVFQNNPKRYKRCKNLLLYELEGVNEPSSLTYCGFIDSAMPKGKRRPDTAEEFFCRALGMADTLRVLQLFKDVIDLG